MICLETFTNKTLIDYPKSEWNDFVNRNYSYAKTTSKCFDWIDKCNDSDLPSEHPYWTYRTQYRLGKAKLKKLEYMLNQLIDKCPDDFTDNSMIGMFNASASAIIGTHTTKVAAIQGLNKSIQETKDLIINFAKKHSNNLR